MLNLQQISGTEKSLIVDAYAYSRDFEQSMSSEIEAFFSILDFVASKLEAQHLNRILTKHEHNYLIKSQVAIKLSPAFKLDPAQSKLIATSFLLEGARKALGLIGLKFDQDALLERHGFDKLQILNCKKYMDWFNVGNLIDFSDSRYKLGLLNDKAVHYLCQLIVFTFTPKDPSEAPDSVIISPETYFNLTNVWASKPELYENNLALSASGKKIIYKENELPTVSYRTDLGRLADLHLQKAQEFWQICQPISAWLAA